MKGFLLETFNLLGLRRWKKVADRTEEYHVKLYHYLEGLRYSRYDSLLESLRATKSTNLDIRSWVRIVDHEYSLSPLSPAGSLIKGGRFNIGNDIDRASPKVFPALYIAEDYETAYRERFGARPPSRLSHFLSGEEFALRSQGSFSAVFLKGALHNLFDMRTAGSLSKFCKIIGHFAVSQELNELADEIEYGRERLVRRPQDLHKSLMEPDWRLYPVQFGIPANPQVFARLLVDAGFEGVIYRSTKGEGHCVAAFPENFHDSFIELRDAYPPGTVHVRLDSTTVKAML